MTTGNKLRFLLIGPYDPHCGEYTFLAPPLGVWRLAGFLARHDIDAQVFDPNCCDAPVQDALRATLGAADFDVVGVSTTAMTLRYDLELAHLVHRHAPRGLLVAGGMEATFNPERLLKLAPFGLAVLGEGEYPLRTLAERLRAGKSVEGIPGTAIPLATGTAGELRVQKFHQDAMTRDELADAVASTPYERMPYERYWQRLEGAYRVQSLPFKADREARLAEIRSVRLATLNYCPMACSFCSSTNFLHAAQGSVARVSRLTADECLAMLERIVATHPDVRTVIFQDDIFVFTKDTRILPLCEAIVAAKEDGRLPRHLEFISTNRIDSMTPERLTAMRRAGFRVLGFGVENFSATVLAEFNKGQIARHIEPALTQATRLGITPFLDLILTSPRARLGDLAETVRQAFRWIREGCEVGIYPYVIPFSGAAMANDPELAAQTTFETVTVPGTAISWRQPVKILPFDAATREAIVAIEAVFNRGLAALAASCQHLPSRVRSLLWIACAERVLSALGEDVPGRDSIALALIARLPRSPEWTAAWLDDLVGSAHRELAAQVSA